jgi:2-dehydro-3-deoxygluconokinase
MSRAFAFGEAMLRLSPPDGAPLEEAASLDVHPAGAELNVAVALASLGMESTWVSALPDSPLGRRVAREAARAGVDTSRIRWVPGGRMGIFFVELGVPPRPISVLYDRRDSAFAAAEPDLSGIRSGDWLVVSGVTAALGPQPAAALDAVIAAAHDAGASVCFDVNYRALLWPVVEAAPRLRALARTADVVVCSERDARRVLELAGEAEEVVRGLREMCAPEARVVVLTRGGEGSVALGDGREAMHQRALAATVIDRLGVGDAFVAGLIWGLEMGELADALRFASALAALKCTVRGDFAQFRPAEVEAAMHGVQEAPVR